jgi:hypothetical protein
MAFKEVNSVELKKFMATGDYVEGYYLGNHRVNTQYGEAVFLEFINDDGEFNVVLTSGMRADWDKLRGVRVKLEYIGDKKNPKTGRTFKEFKIYADYEDSYIPFE